MMHNAPRWPFDLALGAVVAILGLLRLSTGLYFAPIIPALIAVGMGVAVALYRRAPAIALALVWVTALIQVFAFLDIAPVQLGALVVAYGTARYGRTPTVIASLVSIPVGGVAALIYANLAGLSVVRQSGIWDLLGLFTSATSLGVYSYPTGLIIGFVLVAALLGGPWALGFVLRLRAQRSTAEAETARAQQLAEVRAEQARLARDVHDVVGHSLAVIIAQADSARAMPDDQIVQLRAALANVAETARRSLRDVRTVLSDDAGEVGSGGTDDLESLIDGVRSGGTDVSLDVLGAARPLPPELEVIAYRALQELLTNALKHGVAADGIEVRLDWGADELVIAVTNTAAAEPGPGGRTGLSGLRERLAAVGGSLQSGREADRWTTTARVPVRREATS